MQKDGPTDPVEEGQMRPSNVGETLPLVGTGQLKDIRNWKCSSKSGVFIPRMHKGPTLPFAGRRMRPM
jgi:hypothetical protein